MSQHTREIDGRVWTVEPFTGRESLALFRTLTALAAEPLGAALRESAAAVRGEEAVDFSSILAVAGGAVGLAGKVAAKMSDAEFQALAERLLASTLCDGGPIKKAGGLDLLFKGAVFELLKVLAFVVEVNFVGPFVSSIGLGAGSVLAKIKQAMESESAPSRSSATRPNE